MEELFTGLTLSMGFVGDVFWTASEGLLTKTPWSSSSVAIRYFFPFYQGSLLLYRYPLAQIPHLSSAHAMSSIRVVPKYYGISFNPGSLRSMDN